MRPFDLYQRYGALFDNSYHTLVRYFDHGAGANVAFASDLVIVSIYIICDAIRVSSTSIMIKWNT